MFTARVNEVRRYCLECFFFLFSKRRERGEEIIGNNRRLWCFGWKNLDTFREVKFIDI